MEKLAFISYSTEDRDIAERAAALLEARGVGCWIAPDAIPPGTSYAGRIIEGIDSAVATVLILSEAANASVWVAREAERTISKNKTLIPLRIREVQPSRALELFVSAGQSVDAFHPPLEAHIGRVAETEPLYRRALEIRLRQPRLAQNARQTSRSLAAVLQALGRDAETGEFDVPDDENDDEETGKPASTDEEQHNA